jgi:hypothetical membrane protein
MSERMRTRIGTTAAFLGIVAIAIGSVAAALAYAGSRGEPYSPLNHWVSELGELGVSTLALVFNLGLVVGGLGYAVFMALLAASSRGRARWAWGAIGVIAGVAGLLVGVFPMNDIAPHALAALTFFNLGWIAVGLATLDLLRRRDPRFPGWLGMVALVTVLAFVAFLVSLQVDPYLAEEQLGAPPARPDLWAAPALEWLVILGILAWTGLVAWCWRRAPVDASGSAE